LTKEDPGGEAPSAATPAQVVEALRAARARELTRVQELAERLPKEQAHAEKVARSLKRTQGRITAKASVAAREGMVGQPATAEQIGELARELRRERKLELESYQVQAQVQTSLQALEQAQSRLQQLERSLALAMAQARTLAREQAEARSPRLRAIAVARFLWRLLQARPGLWDGIVRNLYLGMRVVGVLVWMLPTADRDRWKNESYNELEELKQEGAPLLGDAIRIASRTPWLALVLWTGAWRRSPAARWLPRLKPVWIGLGTAAATFLGGVAGIGQSPTEFQMRALVVASLLTGALALTGSYKGRRPRRRSRRRRKR
jgi:hypothetical protein